MSDIDLEAIGHRHETLPDYVKPAVKLSKSGLGTTADDARRCIECRQIWPCDATILKAEVERLRGLLEPQFVGEGRLKMPAPWVSGFRTGSEHAKSAIPNTIEAAREAMIAQDGHPDEWRQAQVEWSVRLRVPPHGPWRNGWQVMGEGSTPEEAAADLLEGATSWSEGV